MITRYKYKSNILYSLHDMRICQIEIIDKSLKLYFEDGYVTGIEPYNQVDGHVIIEEIDEDFCFVYLLNDNGELGTFSGRKLTLIDFIKEYKSFSFEVVDESYGYNSVVYNGYLILPKRNDFIELTLTIYHFGDIVYETNE